MEEKEKSKNNKIKLYLVLLLIYSILLVVITLKVEHKFFIRDNDIHISKNQDSSDSISIQKETDTVKNNSAKNTVIELNDVVIKEDVYELTYKGSEFSKKVLPPTLTSFYTYYEAKEEGHQYLVIKLDYKNLEGTSVESDEVASVHIKYNNKYEYTSFPVIVDSDGDFTYANITDINPLTVGQMYYLCDVPDTVANGTESIVAYVKTSNETYEINIR